MDDESRWKITDAEVPFKCVVLWWLKQAPLLILLSTVIVLINFSIISKIARYQFNDAIVQVKGEIDKILK